MRKLAFLFLALILTVAMAPAQDQGNTGQDPAAQQPQQTQPDQPATEAPADQPATETTTDTAAPQQDAGALPQTASPLPLLGLLGLGSLVVGVAARKRK